MILTVDVGGSKVLVATFSDEGMLEKTKKFKTPVMYPDFIVELKKTITELLGDEKPDACSIALPAALDRDAGVALSFGNLPWENVTIRQDLSDTVYCPIYLENDAKMAGLAEANSLSQYSRVLYLTVSTGIGIGLVVNGKIDQSVSDAGGRGLMLEHNGKIMAWEELASGKALFTKTGSLASELPDDSPEWYVLSRNIALMLINLIGLYSPEMIVIGGGVGTHLPKFHEHLHEELELYRSKMITKMPQIMQAQHPEQAVNYGGYLLAKQNLDHQNAE